MSCRRLSKGRAVIAALRIMVGNRHVMESITRGAVNAAAAKDGGSYNWKLVSEYAKIFTHFLSP